MRTPRFWNNINITALILYPLSLLYSSLSKLKFSLQTPTKFEKKIICIGNITVGGAGKTPVAIALGKLLIKNGYRIAYACKNYGGSLIGPGEVENHHTSKEVIDEALLLARIAKTFVAKNRLAAIARAAEQDVDIIISDDGLQNNSFYKDLSILVIDGKIGFGNNFIFPAGPMRESLTSGLQRVDLICVIGKANSSMTEKIKLKETIFLNPIFSKPLSNQYIAFSGIAYPEKFFSALEGVGIRPIKTIGYADHYQYSEQEIIKLLTQATQRQGRLITTEKDLVRIPQRFHKDISVLTMEIKLDDKDTSLLLKYLERQPPSSQ